MREEISKKFQEILGENQVICREPMNRHTTFRIGGPADYFLTPESAEEIRAVIGYCREVKLPYFVLGNGSNLLVSDDGFRGAVIQIDHRMQELTVEGCEIRAQAGVLLSKVAATARDHSLTGFEFASGIPGTLGGGVSMNAGAYGGELKDVLVSVRVLDRDLQLRSLPVEELDLGYRHSRIQDEEMIVTDVTLRLDEGRQEDIVSRMNELREARTLKQPLEFPSAGSTFKRPEGYFAGKLIMDAGLAGFCVGDAQVSEKHCGFVINRGSATAGDVCELIERVQETIREKDGVQLEPEIRFLGFD
uniref:UDP-N-acetylmuramate dehydrogenase n=1 Tax=Eubacterium cellulosolvens TaxID=29322 RepID=UPI0004838382|nr:UDP-N-acetylmuramate dehydrogenase [[Eubacterium] cellulosolvens]